jgi:hypothetical protein
VKTHLNQTIEYLRQQARNYNSAADLLRQLVGSGLDTPALAAAVQPLAKSKARVTRKRAAAVARRNGGRTRTSHLGRAERMAGLVQLFRAHPEPMSPKTMERELGYDCSYLAKKLVKVGAVGACGSTSDRVYKRTGDFDRLVEKYCQPDYDSRKAALGIATTAG